MSVPARGKFKIPTDPANLKTFPEIAPGQRIVAMVEYRGMMILATETQVYAVSGDKIEPLRFEYVE